MKRHNGAVYGHTIKAVRPCNSRYAEEPEEARGKTPYYTSLKQYARQYLKKHPPADRRPKIEREDATMIRELHATGWWGVRELAAAFGLAGVTIYNILANRIWKEKE